jgi:hypothetical protein
MENQYYQQPYQQPDQVPLKEEKGLSVASMVLGIIGIVFSCCFYLTIPAAITGLILGIVSLVKKKGGKGMAVAGVIMCGLSIVLGIIIIAGFVLFFADSETGWADLWPEFWEEINREFQI